MQGADKVNGELEVGFNQAFEGRWFRAERIGRVVMVLFIAAGLAGLFGRGPFSHRTEHSTASGLAIDFEPIAQSQTGTQVTVHVARPLDASTVDLFVAARLVEPMGLQRILPQPDRMQAVPDGMLLTFAVPPGAGDVAIRFALMPAAIGPIHLSARLDGRELLRWTQFVMP